jgi:hypothetical protein
MPMHTAIDPVPGRKGPRMGHAELSYPPNQPPLVLRGICIDVQIGSVIQKIAQESDVARCLNSVYLEGMLTRPKLEQMRANLFRAEHRISECAEIARSLRVH